MKSKLYTLLLLTTVLRVTGDAIESIALPWHLLNQTSSLLSVAGYSFSSMLPWVVFPPLMGSFLDKTEKKVRLAFLALFVQSFLALMIIRFASNIWAFYLLISLISALDILHRYFGFTLIASMTFEGSELQKLNAKLATAGNATSLFAFPLAGFLAYRFGIKAMLLDALFLLLGALTLVPYLNVEVKSERTSKVVEERPMGLNKKLVIGILTSVLLFNFALGSFRIFVFSSLRALEKGEVIYGLLQSLTTVGSLVAALGITYFAHRRKLGIKRPLLAGMLLQSFSLVLVGLPKVAALLPAVFLLGFGGEMLNVSFDSLMQKFIPLESLGTTRGIFDAMATLVIPVSQLAFAWGIENGIAILTASLLATGLAYAGIALLYVCFVKLYTVKRE
ncbi:Permease, major facilitator superfamily [Pyrococcus sp. NA2]|uniref:MFS transporter n=1 Tax=Pyrococcus sp. (strain NA2) TaxID=342949 RepID=UPI000209AB12|nr:MFS transporter [Pyrococcus sp. NA2]AEC52635.1 Permease, major facilitator superfamily [Pyrococcus sp. NA2]